MEQEKALAKLSLAAICIDLMLSVSLWRLGMDFTAGQRLAPYVSPLALVGVMIAHLFVVEVLFGGRSLGRLCCGLTVSSTRTADAMPLLQRLTRFLSIITRFGLGSLNPNRLPSYNCAEGVIFRSDLASEAPVRRKDSRPASAGSKPVAGKAVASRSSDVASSARIRGARLVVTAGPHAGAAVPLASGRTFAATGLFHLGRTPGWSDFVLDRDSRVSSRQCRIYTKDDTVFIADGAEPGKPSRNGTLLNGRPLSSDRFQPVAPGSTIRIGETAFELRF